MDINKILDDNNNRLDNKLLLNIESTNRYKNDQCISKRKFLLEI